MRLRYGYYFFRSDNMYTVRQIDEEENEYIRDIKTLSPYLYVTTDQYVTVYDVRKICFTQKANVLNLQLNVIVANHFKYLAKNDKKNYAKFVTFPFFLSFIIYL